MDSASICLLVIYGMNSSAKTLVISFVGMESQEVAIKPHMRIVLASDAALLDEVIITGYGSAKKVGSVVGSVSSVNNKRLEKNVTANFTDALETVLN